MRVYCLFEVIPYEEDYLIGIFFSEEGAKAELAELAELERMKLGNGEQRYYVLIGPLQLYDSRVESKMKIPPNTKKPRFYVAYSDNEAFSSWNTLEDAKSCIDRFRSGDSYALADAVKIIGIIETSQSSKILHKI